jgi:hypothetical protein
MKKYFFMLFIAVLLLDACKYEHGPFLSCRTKTQRITGVWDVDKYLVDGADSTRQITRQKEYLPWKFGIEKGEASWIASAQSNSDYSKIGFWSFDEKKNKLMMNTYGAGLRSVGPIGVNNTEFSWKITKLTNTKMWLETIYNGKKFELQYKKLQD